MSLRINHSPWHFVFLLVASAGLAELAIAGGGGGGGELSQSEILIQFRGSLRNAAALKNWNSSTPPCARRSAWEGVICRKGEVWGLKLEGMGLSGVIDLAALSKLPNLRSISLMRNRFEGGMPEVKKLSALKAIFLSNNHFSGELDGDAFTGMGNLKKVHLAYNKFEGKVPESLASLPRLLELRIEGNKFTGRIPDFVATPVQSFNVSNNHFVGRIPDALRRMDLSSFLGNKNLCGVPLNPCTPPEKPTKLMMVVVGLVLALALSAIVLAFTFLLLHTRNQITPIVLVEAPPLMKEASRRLERVKAQEPGAEGGRKAELGKLHFVRKMENKCELSDLLKASAEILGSGNFGSSYKAFPDNGLSMVVKRYRHMNNVGKEEFQEHMRRLGRLSHPNLLPLVAYYYREEEKLLVTDFVDNGSLAIHLHGKPPGGQPKLEWSTRLKIIKGIAKGLAYLYSELPILVAPHGHLKSSNVLLTKCFTPLLTDYALSPVINPETARALMIAYKSPEYKEQGRITKKTDVWSLGILMLEMLTGKFPTQHLQLGKAGGGGGGGDDTDMASWVKCIPEEEWESKVFDREMGGTTESNKEEMVKLLKIALACCEGDVGKRWDIKEAVEKIEGIKAEGDHEEFFSSYADSDGESRSSSLSRRWPSDDQNMHDLPLS